MPAGRTSAKSTDAAGSAEKTPNCRRIEAEIAAGTNDGSSSESIAGVKFLGSFAKLARNAPHSASEQTMRDLYAANALQSAIGRRVGEKYRLAEVVDARQNALGVVELS